ncbi:hypothetical protein AB0F43_23200 [Kribbella sp. NPDC023972]|uniref:hypothetical protein n=1 Tax=Kribbella sp. NPDC023972 TaxID=3154795 RepID=UPI0033FA2F77
MKTLRRSLALGVVPALALSALVAAPTAASTSTVDVALEWYDVTADTITAAGAPTQVTNNRTWAIAWLAASRAVLRSPAGSTPYDEAALAGAVHETLVTLVPARKTELDQSLATTLARIPDGPGESAGVAAGRQQAKEVLASRANDGLESTSVNAPFTPPPAAPYTIGSPTAPGVTRTYNNWHQLTVENVDARVWSGIHTRTADTVGATLGKQVAANALRNADKLFR